MVATPLDTGSIAPVRGSLALRGIAGLSARVLAFWFGSLCVMNVWTVPARTTSIPRTRPIVAREIPAFWLYYLRAVFA